MSNLVVTKGYTDASALTKALLDTSFDDISTWLNNRDNASASWLNLSVSSTAAIPVSITSSAATTTVKINNTATDGDPKVSFQLSGSETHAVYVDDSDSDYLKFDVSGGTAFQILPGATPRVEFRNGSATTPSRAFISDVQTGPYQAGTHEYGISIFGVGQVKITDGTYEGITDNDIDLGTTTHRFKNSYQYGMVLVDGVTAPGTISGHAIMYVDTADGDLKIKFGDGTIKTIVLDT